MRKRLAAGNWKMNGGHDAEEVLRRLVDRIGTPECEVLICPPATLIHPLANTFSNTPVQFGGQDCHSETKGAHTGDIAAQMIKDAGAQFVILGHSERRTDHGETDTLVRDKTRAAWAAGLSAIVCVGETLEQRDAANTLDIIGGQLASSIPDGATAEKLVVAYEPVWAIGTGKVPTKDQIGEVHDFIRARLERRFGEGVGRSTRILYGGSMNPSNAHDIIQVSNVDGGLIGGASLKADDFAAIISALS